MPPPSNVVLLLSDEHNPFFSSPYGDTRIDTPNMQRMANGGALFQNAYCPSPLCLPCRAAFTAGRYAHETQAYNNSNVNLTTDFDTWGRALDRQGVHSVMVGKVDAFAPSSDLGYSEEIVTGDRAFPGDTNISRNPMAIRHGANERCWQFGPKNDPYPHDDCAIENAIHWLETKASGIGKPFAMAINILAPHFPHYCHHNTWDKYAFAEDLPKYGTEEESAQHPRSIEQKKHFQVEAFPEEAVRGLRRGYYACVDYVDQQLGRIMKALENAGISGSTNLIYASDHGEMLGKFGMWWKCSLYEDSARIPIIATGPDFGNRGIIKTPVNLLDVQAEFFKSTGATIPEGMKGRALSEISNDEPETFAFSEYHGHGASESAFMVRKGEWKLIYHFNAPHQLFNLSNDPDELDNLYDAEPRVANELENDLRSICDPDAENKRAHEFVNGQVATIEEEDLSYAIYDRNIGKSS
ncbi:MAG: hypothetical protein CMI15_08530 [Opitutaceae bacterium]|nr:hypothetical protein [Opitutaceae bacterium]